MKQVSKTKVEGLQQKGALLFDIRSPVVYRFNKVKNSVNLPLTNLINKLVGVKKDSKLVIIYDEETKSNLSTISNYAMQLGIENISSIEYSKMLEE